MSNISSCYFYLMNPFFRKLCLFHRISLLSQVDAVHLILSNYQEQYNCFLMLLLISLLFVLILLHWFSSMARSWQSFHGFTSLVMLFSSNSFKVAKLASWSFFRYSKYCRFDCAILPIGPYDLSLTVLRLSLIHIWRCRRITGCRSRWSPYH